MEKHSKNELHFRLDIEKRTAKEVLNVLKSLHYHKLTLIQLQQKFYYSHNQDSEEMIDDYANALVERFLKIFQTNPDIVADKDKVLKETFANGVFDPCLKREMKLLNAEQPTLKFFNLEQR